MFAIMKNILFVLLVWIFGGIMASYAQKVQYGASYPVPATNLYKASFVTDVHFVGLRTIEHTSDNVDPSGLLKGKLAIYSSKDDYKEDMKPFFLDFFDLKSLELTKSIPVSKPGLLKDHSVVNVGYSNGTLYAITTSPEIKSDKKAVYYSVRTINEVGQLSLDSTFIIKHYTRDTKLQAGLDVSFSFNYKQVHATYFIQTEGERKAKLVCETTSLESKTKKSASVIMPSSEHAYTFFDFEDCRFLFVIYYGIIPLEGDKIYPADALPFLPPSSGKDIVQVEPVIDPVTGYTKYLSVNTTTDKGRVVTIQLVKPEAKDGKYELKTVTSETTDFRVKDVQKLWKAFEVDPQRFSTLKVVDYYDAGGKEFMLWGAEWFLDAGKSKALASYYTSEFSSGTQKRSYFHGHVTGGSTEMAFSGTTFGLQDRAIHRIGEIRPALRVGITFSPGMQKFIRWGTYICGNSFSANKDGIYGTVSLYGYKDPKPYSLMTTRFIQDIATFAGGMALNLAKDGTCTEVTEFLGAKKPLSSVLSLSQRLADGSRIHILQNENEIKLIHF